MQKYNKIVKIPILIVNILAMLIIKQMEYSMKIRIKEQSFHNFLYFGSLIY